MDEALTALRKFFGFEQFREGQHEVVEAVLAGHDTVVVMPTGGGKSLCFQLPALMRDGVTVVVSPLIALMKDQVDALRARGLPATFINSSLDFEEQKERIAGLRRGEYKLLYVAPERFRST
ncbi:MAG: recombinase RecQ, partial [Acidobacteria bacterium]